MDSKDKNGKLQVYIDFEAISARYKYRWSNKDVPYAYSIGIYVAEKWVTKTFVLDFYRVKGGDLLHKNIAGYILSIIRSNIEKDVQLLLGKADYKITRDNTIFVSWDPTLEKSILNPIFTNVEVLALNGKNSISLSKITNNTIEKKYFKCFSAAISQVLDERQIAKLGLCENGCLASFAGYVLFAKANHQAINWQNIDNRLEIDEKKLLAEIKEYSVDDVNRMAVVVTRGQAWFNEVVRKNALKIKEKTQLNKLLKESSFLLKKLAYFDQKLSLAELKSILTKNVESAHQEGIKLEQLFLDDLKTLDEKFQPKQIKNYDSKNE